MILKAFSVFDLKAGAYMQPFYFQSTGLAVRAFADTVNDGKSTLSKHAGDFTLYEIGWFDDAKGEHVNLEKHVNLGVGLSFVTEPELPFGVVKKE